MLLARDDHDHVHVPAQDLADGEEDVVDATKAEV